MLRRTIDARATTKRLPFAGRVARLRRRNEVRTPVRTTFDERGVASEHRREKRADHYQIPVFRVSKVVEATARFREVLLKLLVALLDSLIYRRLAPFDGVEEFLAVTFKR